MQRPIIEHIDHIVVFTSDIKRALDFYSVFLGEPITSTAKLLKYSIGSTDVFFCLPNHREHPQKYNKDSVGVNHIALRVQNDDLSNLAELLTHHHISHSGVQIDRHSGNDYIWFDDPDGIRIELFSRNAC